MTQLLLRTAALVAATAALLPVASTDARAAQLCGREVSSVPELMEQVARDAGGKTLRNDQQFIAYADERARVVWTFAKEGTPPAPAVICRRPFLNAGKVEVETQAMCGGPANVCGELVAAFKAIPVD